MPEKIEKSTLLSMYKNMKLTRRFDDVTIDLMNQGEIPGPLHPSIGMEAIGVGLGTAMIDGDFICATHRTLSAQITRGAEIKHILAEFMGRVDGYMSGKGGSMHISGGLDKGMFSIDSVVGSRAGFGTGIALALKLSKKNNVVVAGYGDGGANQGPVHEAMNMAAIWSLPILYFCENNQYAATTSVKYSSKIENLSQRAAAYGFSGETIDAMNVMTVYNAAKKAIDKIRSGGGPHLIECKAYRYRGHWSGEELQTYIKYRDKDEIALWKSKDPLLTFSKELTETYGCTQAELQAVDKEVEDIMDEAVEFARNSKFPEPEEALRGMYASPYPNIPHKGWID